MSDRSQARVNYDAIAPLYDSQPYRQKTVDAQLIAFLRYDFCRPHSTLAILDMACGTGNQLVANQGYLEAGLLVGLDVFQGMLRQAQAKTRHIGWVQADCAQPPFAAQRFDFITNQFALHHVQDKAAMIHAVAGLLKPGGRFVMTNVCPREMPDWIYYQYFPTAFVLDCQDFLARQALVELMQQAGFCHITAEVEPLIYAQDLPHFLATVQRRDTCSQLLTIADADYHAGIRKLEGDIAVAGNRAQPVHTRMCLLTLRGETP